MKKVPAGADDVTQLVRTVSSRSGTATIQLALAPAFLPASTMYWVETPVAIGQHGWKCVFNQFASNFWRYEDVSVLEYFVTARALVGRVIPQCCFYGVLNPVFLLPSDSTCFEGRFKIR